MWMVKPKFLCRKHLLGEHGELHKHRPSFIKKHSMTGRIHPIVLIQIASMKKRHDELAEEMLRRGYNHKSPYEQPDTSYLPIEEQNAKVDLQYNLKDLSERCEECRNRING